MFITAALEGGRNFTERGIERYIVMVREGGARPVIILNKCDLCTEEERSDFIKRAKSVSGEIPVLMVSALTGEGMEAMRSLLCQGITAAFTGPSGVGKSALINSLLEENSLRTGAIRDDDKRGRHTTTHQELYVIEGGAMVIDTPGLRELRPYAEAESVEMTFAEIAEAAVFCKFKDCTHTDEPGCNVLRLISEGAIEHDRYQSYITLIREMEVFEMRRTEKGRAEQKAREKNLSKVIRQYKKNYSD
jgi:ribosome biogenesis GTPase